MTDIEKNAFHNRLSVLNLYKIFDIPYNHKRGANGGDGMSTGFTGGKRWWD